MKYLNEIREILEIDDISSVNEEDKLEDHNFDSLAAINLITFISDKSEIEIDPDEFENLQTMKELNDFILTKLEN